MAIRTKALWAICMRCGEYWPPDTTACPDCNSAGMVIRCGFCGKAPGTCTCTPEP